MMPYEISFVDKDNIVRFFNKKDDYIFKRNKNSLDKDVMKCHPKKIIPEVEKIFYEFKNRATNYLEFKLNRDGKKVYTRYYAVRDENGEYLGALEIVQEVDDILNLDFK